MQYDRAADGTLTPLPFKSVDTGMGLERTTSILQGVDSNYKTDLFVPIIERLAQFIGHDPETVESERFSYQVVADHSRAMTFLIGEGVAPANDGAGYVLRRIMRRAVRHGRLMGIERPFLSETCGVVIDIMGGAYPQLAQRRDEILAGVEAEELKFSRTLEAGSERLAQLVDAAGKGGRIGGTDAFRLHDTFGFPIDLTVEIAADAGVGVDREGFEWPCESSATDRALFGRRPCRWTTSLHSCRASSSATRTRTTRMGSRLPRCASSLTVTVARWSSSIAHRSTPKAVARSGMEASSSAHGVGCRSTTRSAWGARSCTSDSSRARWGLGDVVEAHVDERARWGAARNHTGTHLLHRALRDVIGEQAKQAGSWVGPDGLRFDFPASAPTPRATLREVERRVNEQIRRDRTVTPSWMSLSEAQELGADMFFGEKYVPESVRVVQVDGYSKELCGGTHVTSTGQIGSFRIVSEASVGAGLRRIEAVTGEASEELVATRLEALHATAQLLGERDENVPGRVEGLLARLRDAERVSRDGKPVANATRLDAAAALEGAQQAGETHVVVERYAEADASALRGLADDLRSATGRFVLVAAGDRDGRPTLLVAASRDLVGEGFDSASIVRGAAPLMGGGGGGRADLAQAGGKEPARLDDALREAGRLALESLANLESG